MQDVHDGSKSPRGSSPPLLEQERWIEDGAGGSHWVRMPSFNPDRTVDRAGEPISCHLEEKLLKLPQDDGDKSIFLKNRAVD